MSKLWTGHRGRRPESPGPCLFSFILYAPQSASLRRAAAAGYPSAALYFATVRRETASSPPSSAQRAASL